MGLLQNNLTPGNRQRVDRILEVIMSYARLDFKTKTEVLGNDDILDAIGAGVNMLGEELENSTVSLREKEQLLKEVHHRVKNNLQVISSLLNLQSATISDKKYLDLIQDSRRRIQSMALVHEMLYSARDLSRISIAEYVSELCATISSSYELPDSHIVFCVDVDNDLHFDVDKMIPLGLMINEAVSNSYKYAFPQRTGTITVSLKRDDQQYKLEIGDNGIGFTETSGDGTHLGIELIHMLAGQIDGKLEVSNLSGTKYELTFQ